MGLVGACPAAREGSLAESGIAALRVRNERDTSVVVVMDRCASHTRVALVAGGAQERASLPDIIVRWTSGYRFLVYEDESGKYLGTLHLGDPEGDMPPVLTIPSEFTDPVPSRAGEGPPDYERFRAVATSRNGDQQAVSVFAGNTPGVLLWYCADRNTPRVILSTGGDIPNDHAFAQLFSGRDSVASDTVPVVRSITDAVLIPDGWVRPLLESLSGAGARTGIRVEGDRLISTTHLFHSAGVVERLATLECVQAS